MIKFSVLVSDNFREALFGSSRKVFTFIRSELRRHVNKFRRRMVKERMSGPPGIRGGKMREKKNKNLKVFVFGSRKETLTAGATISRFLRSHEEGRIVRPKRGDFLFLREGRSVGKKKGKIFAKVGSVKVPARLGFVKLWRQMEPEAVQRISRATDRGLKVQGQRRLSKIFRVIGQAA